MKIPGTPHYHVVCRDGGEVWSFDLLEQARIIGSRLRVTGRCVDYYACPVNGTCPKDVTYRWRTGRAPTRVRPLIGRRKPRKSIAYERARTAAYRTAMTIEDDSSYYHQAESR